MGKTNPPGPPLLPFFERLVSKTGVLDAWSEFRAEEDMGAWGFVAFDETSEGLNGLLRDDSAPDGLAKYQISFFDWFSRRVRPEVDRVLRAYSVGRAG